MKNEVQVANGKFCQALHKATDIEAKAYILYSDTIQWYSVTSKHNTRLFIFIW